MCIWMWMSGGVGKCSRMWQWHMVRVRQMWRRKGAQRIPSDVPAGHVAVCVGSKSRRFVVRATYLNHPVLKKLLVEAEEEYGFSNLGPLAIPCDEALFEQLLRFISRSLTTFTSTSNLSLSSTDHNTTTHSSFLTLTEMA
ncbi:hypothetical protein VNO78_00331 [Psophocarpus tetragonolobus]|uniref:Uncharacterized protein n=1 Tax=Psophocarpus tetragonolobus TaxID=3891 RepID=A0AAN9SX11_PSOTE